MLHRGWVGGSDISGVVRYSAKNRQPEKTSLQASIIQGVSKTVTFVIRILFLMYKLNFTFFHICFRIRILSLLHPATPGIAIQCDECTSIRAVYSLKEVISEGRPS